MVIMHVQKRAGRCAYWETDGQLFDSFENTGLALGAVYYKGGESFRATHKFGRPALLFARCHSVLEMKAPLPPCGRRFLEAANILLVPVGYDIKVKAVTALSHLAIFCPSDKLFSDTAREYGLSANKMLATFASVRLLPRTNWINELMHRYIFELVEAGGRNKSAMTFVPRELIKEIYYLAESWNVPASVFNLDASGQYGHSDVIKRAVASIETNLFSHISLQELARAAFTSKASLLRVFNREFAKTPVEYIRERRLDESLSMLRSGQYSIGEIAGIIGYNTPSGFNVAFKQRFGCAPLVWRGSHNCK